MNKNNYITLVISSFTFLFLISCGNKIDWSENYRRNNTEPYGAKSLYELLPEFMGDDSEVEVLKESLKEFLPESIKDTITKIELYNLGELDTLNFETANFLFVKRRFQLSPGDANTMDLMIRKGSHVIIASNSFGTTFSENYNISLDQVPNFPYEPDTALLYMKFQPIFFKSEKGPIQFQVREQAVRNHFTNYPESFTPILTDTANHILAIHSKVGKGSITICSSPKIFSNFQLVHSNYFLLNHFFNLIPKQKTYWGNNYASYDPKTEFKESEESTLEYIFKYPSMKWAFWIILIMGLLYTLNNMRRLQKPFKTPEEKNNMSLSYISTVAQLYMKSGSYAEIIKKKSDLFYWNLSRKYGIGKNESVEDIISLLTKRITDLDETEISDAVHLAYQAQENIVLSKHDFVLANKKIDRIKKRL